MEIVQKKYTSHKQIHFNKPSKFKILSHQIPNETYSTTSSLMEKKNHTNISSLTSKPSVALKIYIKRNARNVKLKNQLKSGHTPKLLGKGKGKNKTNQKKDLNPQWKLRTKYTF